MDATKQSYYQYLKELFLNAPFSETLNIIGTEAEPGQATLYMEIKPDKHMNTNQTLHGGVTASLLDTASGMSVRTLLDETETIATVNLSINFLKPGFSGKLTAKGHVKSKGKKMATVEAEVFDENNNLLANSIGTFVILQKK
ncbi:PaaI family thioesterase [Bacillus sp. AGMB 02131]|uniref:PaaI family thioesterase n=1 Tax=Peribacillus faecalis TaxID=2772559 RepID=A0A927CZB1_9BACI|nr:PaaI family thioesterase [Peribacillus faecalis]MBD3110458.1 PaaI family thioesterase [Peribacillus faecalis]